MPAALGLSFSLATLDTLLHDDDHKSDNLATPEEYKLFWMEVADADMPEDRGDHTTTGQRGHLPFWRQVENTINSVLREFAIVGCTDKMRPVRDDHKDHYNIHGQTFGGPKETQHVRDNVRGFTCHQTVASASQTLHGVTYDGPGDTTMTSTERLIRQQFTPGIGTNTNRSLVDISFFRKVDQIRLVSFWLQLAFGYLHVPEFSPSLSDIWFLCLVQLGFDASSY